MPGAPCPLADRVAALMRNGGWRRVTVAATMGRLGTDVLGVAADGRRWVVRCHPDTTRLEAADVRRFAESMRNLRRGDVAVLATSGAVPAALREIAQASRVMLVDRHGLQWWAGV